MCEALGSDVGLAAAHVICAVQESRPPARAYGNHCSTTTTTFYFCDFGRKASIYFVAKGVKSHYTCARGLRWLRCMCHAASYTRSAAGVVTCEGWAPPPHGGQVWADIRGRRQAGVGVGRRAGRATVNTSKDGDLGDGIEARCGGRLVLVFQEDPADKHAGPEPGKAQPKPCEPGVRAHEGAF